jgi:phospholipid/cholesterol/gamma-HCH transport system substrate-binding protein
VTRADVSSENRFRRLIERLTPGRFTEMNRRSVGIVAVSIILSLCIAAFAVGSLDLLEHRYEVRAVFPDAAGLKTGSLVRLAGVDVGEVTGLEADRRAGQVVVTFEVDDDVKLGPDTTARVALSTLLGGQYIRLADVAGSPRLADQAVEDRRIPLSRTSIPFSVTETFNAATDVVDAIDTDAVNDMVTEFADLATDSGPRVERVLRALTDVSRAFNQRQGAIRDLLDQSETLTATLAEKDEAIAALIDSSNIVLDQIADRRTELATILGDGSDAVARLAAIVTSRRAQLEAILEDLDIVTDAVATHQDDVDTILAWSGPTYQQVAAIASHGPYIDVLPTSLGPDPIGALARIYPQLGLTDPLPTAATP